MRERVQKLKWEESIRHKGNQGIRKGMPPIVSRIDLKEVMVQDIKYFI